MCLVYVVELRVWMLYESIWFVCALITLSHFYEVVLCMHFNCCRFVICLIMCVDGHFLFSTWFFVLFFFFFCVFFFFKQKTAYEILA